MMVWNNIPFLNLIPLTTFLKDISLKSRRTNFSKDVVTTFKFNKLTTILYWGIVLKFCRSYVVIFNYP